MLSVKEPPVKLIIQIPCFNEEKTLPLVFEGMPRHIPGIDVIEYQIIDDGSTDNTVKVARSLGVHHIVSAGRINRRWLGRAFRAGIDHALKQGADIVVNTDGDNQYPSRYIADLVRPIVEGRADIAIGDRAPGKVKEFSWIKQRLQVLGSGVIQSLTGLPVKDAVSGFRAYSRDALLKIHVLTNYTYTVDTLIQSHQKGLDIEWVPITVNAKTRESRLITSISAKVRKSGGTILRMVTLYRPFRTFMLFSAMFLVPGVFLLARFFYYYIVRGGQGGTGLIQSVVIGGVCVMVAVQMFVLGILADLLAANRTLIEDLLVRMRKLELPKSAPLQEDVVQDQKRHVG
jgi:glycosyltransferase involved in cell wall biosynthesis